MAISRNVLKLFAFAFMFIDHSGHFVFNDMPLLRGIGRLAFPIFVYLLADGYRHSRDIEKYARRILFAWLISIVPYSLAFYGELLDFHQNIYLSQFLYLGLYCILDQEIPDYNKAAMVIVCMWIAEVFELSYGAYGVLIALFMFYYEDYGQQDIFVWVTCASVLYGIVKGTYIQVWAGMSVAFLPGIGGVPESKRPSKLTSATFYLFYPVHLLFFAFLK